jgi:Zn-dependent peptidase ImmA (M78 family)
MMSDIPPVGTQLGVLSITDIFVEYDGPKLFACINELGQLYLSIFVDEDDESEWYVYAPQSAGRMRDLIAGHIGLRDAILKPSGPHVWAVRRSLESAGFEIKSIPASELPETWLPPADANLAVPGAEPESGSEGSNAVCIDIQWAPDPPELDEHAAPQFPRVEIRLAISGSYVWGDESSGVVLDAREALRFLARSWAYFSWEDGLPLDLPFGNLRDIRDELDRKRSRAPHSLRRSLELSFNDFMFGHDLSQMSSAGALPSVVLATEGAYGWILREDDAGRYGIEDLLGPLESLALALVEGLERFDDQAARGAINAWSSRWSLTNREAAEIVTGLSSEEVRFIEEASEEFRRELAQFDGPSPADPSKSELLAAARLSAGLAPEHIAEIVSLIGPIPGSATDDLDRLSKVAPTQIAGHVFAFDQGLEAARWLRKTLDIPLDDPVDPEQILIEYGVLVKHVKLRSARSVDAIAAWGSRRGPCILINTFGVHAQGSAGRRTTAAHEFCHLLLDRVGALPIAEVLRGQESTVVEARARAFAAEFLLPQQVAGDAYQQSPDKPKRVVKRLSDRYGVSAELVAWNIKNSGVPITDAGRKFLSQLVQRPWRF